MMDKRILSLLLAGVMFGAALPVQALNEETVQEQPEGAATAETATELTMESFEEQEEPAALSEPLLYTEGEAIVCVELSADTGEASRAAQLPGLLAEAEELAVFGGAAVLNGEASVLQEDGSDIVSSLRLVRSDKMDTETLLAELETLPNVVFAEPNYIFYPAEQDVTDSQWAFDITNEWSMQIPGWNRYRTDGTPDPAVDTAGIVVAVMDTGVNYTLDDLKNVMWTSTAALRDSVGGGVYGYSVDSADGEPLDQINGHGTKCASVIAAQWNNSGMSGALSGAKILAVDALDDTTSQFSTATVAKGFAYLYNVKRSGVNLKAINCSWSGGNHSNAVNYFATKLGELGVVTVFAAGNDSKDLEVNSHTPSTLKNNPYVLVVSSSDQDGSLSSFSNFGRSTADLAAPGRSIRVMSTTGNTCTYSNGTSFSAPVVTAEAALLAAYFRDSDAAKTAARILASAKPSASMQGKTVSGGIANVTRALDETTYVPVVQSVQASAGTLTIQGWFFGNTAGTVMLDNRNASVKNWSDREIEVLLPAGFEGGEVCVTVSSSQGKGHQYLEVTANDDFYERLPLPADKDSDFYQQQLDALCADRGSLYLLSENFTKDSIFLWKWQQGTGDNGWSRIASLDDVKLASENLCVWNGKLAALIEQNNAVKLAVCDPYTGRWTITAVTGMDTTIRSQAMAVSGNHLVLAGGEDASKKKRTEIYLVDLTSGKAVEAGTLKTARSEASAVAMEDGSLWLIGGQTSSGFSMVLEQLTPADGSVTVQKVSSNVFPGLDMNQNLKSTGITGANGTILLFGPVQRSNDGSITADTFQLRTSDADPRMSSTGRMVSSGKMYNVRAAAMDGKFYLLAQTTAGENTMVFAQGAIPGAEPVPQQGELVYNPANGKTEYRINGELAEDGQYTGLVKHTNGWLYNVVNSVVDFSFTGLKYHTDGATYYLIDGAANPNSSYEGLVRHSNGWFYYIKNSRVVWNKTGLFIDGNQDFWYIYEGECNAASPYKGLVKHQDGWMYYIEGGKLDTSYNGFVPDADNNFYYIVQGSCNTTGRYELAVQHLDGLWYFVRNGVIDFTYNGNAPDAGGTMHVFTNGVAAA